GARSGNVQCRRLGSTVDGGVPHHSGDDGGSRCTDAEGTPAEGSAVPFWRLWHSYPTIARAATGNSFARTTRASEVSGADETGWPVAFYRCGLGFPLRSG